MSGSATQPARRYTTIAECATWRRRAREGESGESIAREARFSASTVGKHVRSGEGCGHATEAETGEAPVRVVAGGHGVHADPDEDVIERVCEALCERLERNVGNTIYLRAGHLARDCDSPAGQRVNAALCALAEGGRRGLVVERTNPRANRARWMVRRVGGESA